MTAKKKHPPKDSVESRDWIGTNSRHGNKPITLTRLYNKRPPWLSMARKKLDEAVFAAYGWPADLTDQPILERLLAPNKERA